MFSSSGKLPLHGISHIYYSLWNPVPSVKFVCYLVSCEDQKGGIYIMFHIKSLEGCLDLNCLITNVLGGYVRLSTSRRMEIDYLGGERGLKTLGLQVDASFNP